MNILHINKYHYYRDGASIVYLRTARLLETHGHRSVFFSMKSPGKSLLCETDEYFMPYVNLNAESLSLVSQLKIAGRFLYSFEAKKRLSMLLDKFPVDIAHIHNIYAHISPSILHELKKRKIPVVMTLHDYKMVCGSHAMLLNVKPCEDCYKGRYFMTTKNMCVKDSLVKSLLTTIEMYLHHKVLDIYDNVDIFISPSLFLLSKHKEMGFKKEIVYLPNFIDIREFDELNKNIKEEKEERGYSFIYIGRISSEKGLWTLIEAAELLTNEKKDRKVEIKIIGDGPIKKVLQEKLKAEKINNVRFFGHVTGKALYQELKKSSALVLPSEWYENNPLSVLEAFALSKPVIGARIGGIPELVKDNETGFTFESGNEDELSSKIKYLRDNPDKAAEMGKNGRVFVEQELNAEKHYEKLIEIYEKAISKNSLRQSIKLKI